MSKTQTKINNLEKQRITNCLTKKQYNNPWNDTDPRQEVIFDHILALLQKGYTWRFDTSMTLGNLAKNTAVTEYIFSILQPRNEKSGDREGISQYAHNFYVLGHRLKRVIVMAEIQSLLYTLAGGKRTAAHLLGIKNGHASLCDAIVLIPPSNLEEYEILDDLKFISDASNAENTDATRDMDMASYANALRAKWDLLCRNPNHWASTNMGNIQELKIRQWAKSFLKNTYSYEPVESVFGNIFNQVFSQDRGQVYEELSTDDIKKLWSNTFPNQEWVEEPTNGQCCQVVAYSRLERQAFIPINNEWLKRASFSTQRDEVGVVLKLDPRADSISTVLENKEKALQFLTEYNKCSNYEKAGAALVTRVLFPSHINHGDDKLTAFEWVKSKQDFFPVKL